MCKLASFLHNPRIAQFAVYNLVSHSDTQSKLNLPESQGWYEGHYLPNGEISCRMPDGNANDMMNAVAKARWPEFFDFLKWALTDGKADVTLTDGSDEGIEKHLDLYRGKNLGIAEMVAYVRGMQPKVKVSSSGYTPIFDAVIANDGAAVHAALCVDRKAVNELTKDVRRTPLIKLLSGSGDAGVKARIVALLIETGADVNYADREGNTALIFAAHASNTAAVEALLRAGASPMAADSRGHLPFQCASDTNTKLILYGAALAVGYKG